MPSAQAPHTGQPRTYNTYLVIIITTAVIVLAIIFPFISRRTLTTVSSTMSATTSAVTASASTAATSAGSRAPVYFISHGGPPSMFDTASQPYKSWQETGRRIRADVASGLIAKDKGLVCVSAHWEGSDTKGNIIEVNTDTSNPLIYDFYNFPKHYYQQTFRSTFSPENVEDVSAVLGKAGFKVKEEKRGLDHGLWVPFKIMFPGSDTNASAAPPIIQISLPGNGSEESSEKLGKALAGLRDQGYAIVGTGQVVHNLRDFMMARSRGESLTGSQSYGSQYLAAVVDAVSETPSAKSYPSVQNLFKHPLYQRSHPTPEHLLPLAVAAGAAVPENRGPAEKVFEFDEGPLGWAIFRWE